MQTRMSCNKAKEPEDISLEKGKRRKRYRCLANINNRCGRTLHRGEEGWDGIRKEMTAFFKLVKNCLILPEVKKKKKKGSMWN